MLAITRSGGGSMAELKRGIEGGVDCWAVLHGLEVGGGLAWCGGGARHDTRRKKG
jgi:hypothetical protein